MDPERYKTALRICQLNDDLKNYKYRDKTLIGDKGIKINESMKTRIALAWAVFADREIILMDNFLTSLAPHLRKNILEDVIMNEFKGKTRIIVPYSFHCLPCVDWIIALENGKIVFNGDYEELVSSEYF